jgi:uncharacterized protein YkwD
MGFVRRPDRGQRIRSGRSFLCKNLSVPCRRLSDLSGVLMKERTVTRAKRGRRLLLIQLLLLAACAPIVPVAEPGGGGTSGRTVPPAPPSSPAPGELAALAVAVHERVNTYRRTHGLAPLTLDGSLSRLAEEHSRRMASGEVPFGHDGFEERARTIRRSMAYRRVAENVGYERGYADPASQAVQDWLRSPPHLANVTGDFALTGIGVAADEAGRYYFTQIFLESSPMMFSTPSNPPAAPPPG